MAPREWITVGGFASAGKKTLIEKLLAGEMRERFQIHGSVGAYGSWWTFAPVEEIFDADADHVLFQWQRGTDRVIERLLDRFPDSSHRAIVIWRPWADNLRDFMTTYGAQVERPPSLATFAGWWTEEIEGRFRNELPALGIPVELVDGSTPRYDRLTWADVEARMPAGE